jgi:Ser/Thr protein kinase RdoA (MazF antagonist)
MPLFPKTTVSATLLATAVQQHWGLELGKCIKASQNHTFEAAGKDGTRYIVRATPDPSNSFFQKIVNEITFVREIAKSPDLQDQVCLPVPPLACSSFEQSENWVVRSGEVLIVVSEFAKGEMLDLANHTWMYDQRLVEACGRWIGFFHVASAKFCREHPSVANRIQRWDEVHDGVMKGVSLHPDDRLAEEKRDPKRYGVLHGDVNCSNFFYCSRTAQLSVFDWDQVEQGWFMYDLAQPIFAPYIFARAGAPGGNAVSADPLQFTNWLVAGYESVMGRDSVDRDALNRMLMLRRSLYDRFSRRALQEGDTPPDMKGFLEFIVKWLDREEREAFSKKLLVGGIVALAAVKMFLGWRS